MDTQYVTYNETMDSGQVTFEGNNNDLMAVSGAIVAVTVLMSCVPGMSCLPPFIPGVLGLLALLSADQAVDPKRTRMYAWVGIGFTIFTICMMALIVLFYVGIFAFSLSMSASEFN